MLTRRSSELKKRRRQSLSPFTQNKTLPYQPQAARVSQQEVDCNKRKKWQKVFEIRAAALVFFLFFFFFKVRKHVQDSSSDSTSTLTNLMWLAL